MNTITPQMARAELARRELAKRQSIDQVDNQPKPEGFFHKLPRNIIAGLANLGHSTLNLPHDVVEGVENLGEKFGGMMGFKDLPPEIAAKVRPHKRLSEYIPHQQEHDYAEMLGQKGQGTLMDKILQKGIEYAPEIASGRALLRAGLRKFPVTKHGAARQLREAEKMVNTLEARVPISSESIESAMPFLPKTHATKEMIQGAAAGEYKPAFSLQSQVGHHERNLRSSPLASERLLAPEARDLKQNMLNEMQSALRNQGHHKAADLLKGGINDYSKYIKFRNSVWPVLKKLGMPPTVLALTAFGIKKGKDTLSGLVD